ncbi:MAG: FtsX-like permease family protein [Clostridia bacterium]|nr:FtsX-like permease family protein [Clostridia bacterium]
MNIFKKLTLKELKLNKKRTAATIIGVILSAALFTAVISFISSTLFNMEKEVRKTSGNYHITVSDVTKSDFDKILKETEIENPNYLLHVGYVPLNLTNKSAKPYLSIESMDNNFRENIVFSIISGRMPRNSSELILPSNFKNDDMGNYKLNDVVKFDIGERKFNNDILGQGHQFFGNDEKFEKKFQKEYKIVGFYTSESYGLFSGAAYTALTIEDAETNKDNTYKLFISLSKPLTQGGKVYSKLFRISDFVDKTLLFDIECIALNSSFKKSLYLLALIFIIIIFVGSVSLIYNSFSISVAQRTKEFGMLASIGATRKQLFKSVLFEANIISIVGMIFGFALGCVGIGVTLWKTGDIFNSLLMMSGDKFVFHISWPVLVLAILLTYITVVVSASIPIIKGTKVAPITAIKENNFVKIKKKKNYKTPKLVSKIFGFEGTLSHKYYKRSKNQYRTTIIAISMSVILFVCSNSFVTYLNNIFSSQVAMSPDIFDYFITYIDENETGEKHILEMADKIANNEKISQTEIVYEMGTEFGYFEADKKEILPKALNEAKKTAEIRAEAGDISLTPVKDNNDRLYLSGSVFFMDEASFKNILKANNIKNYGNEALIYLPKYSMDSKGKKIANEELTKKLTHIYYSAQKTKEPKKIENTIMIKELPSISNLEYGSSNNITICLPLSQAPKYRSSLVLQNPHTLFIKAKDGQEKQLGQDLDKIIEKENSNYHLINFYEQIELIKGAIFVLKVFSYGFTILISLISLANLFNVIYTNVMLRQKDLAVLRSVGMTEKSIKKSTIYEALNYSVRSLFWGVSLSMGLNYLMFMALNKANDMVSSFYVPKFPVIFAITSVVLLIFITMLYFIKQTSKQNIIETIRNQNV